MFLKALILRGFKTFADPTEVEFSEDARITAIVGPNGCGKSNLLDAIRWALGEDNPRELRVAELEDIVFAGTASRKALSMAEVSLVFDNATGTFSLPFSEVAIKRRTFREAPSEFFINKNLCRLKDIKDLLHDTGLGEGTYSIITQGKVDALLSSRGEEKRLVFEEAAGINKYKSRKISAQKKLISAEQNILRINDLKIEIGEQLINLEDQAKKARHYLEIQSRIKELDVALCHRQLLSIFEKKEALNVELTKIKQQAKAKLLQEEKREVELLALREKHLVLEQEIDALSSKLEQEKDRLRDIELDRRFITGELEREEQRFASLETELQNVQEKTQKITAELEQESKATALTSSLLNNLFGELLVGIEELITNLSSLSCLFGGKPISLNFGKSPEKEEAYKMKKELLKEEEQRIINELEKLRFGMAAHKLELQNLNAAPEEQPAKQALMLEIAQKKAEKELLAQNIIIVENTLRSEDKDGRKNIGEEAALEIALARLDSETDNLRERMLLEYNLSLEEVQNTAPLQANIGKIKKEVEEGRMVLRQLEPVNLLAVEEFEKGKERLSFIDAQLEDLSSARNNLQTLIKELDLKAEQTFLKTMQDLSVVFSQTFATLFSGGEAKITLAPDSPPLEADIDISVRPSGRKWLPLSLLSGGERSLSAIAILFSLLKIRPSPFCFLDEVDAALDDANIGRFASMLKDFSSQSQILVITHNKCTMAVADNIYGITMEEPGVSKIISMRLSSVPTG